MPYDDHKNFSYSAVATAPAPATSGTSLVVTAGEGTRFPTPPFNATIWPASQLAIPTNAEIVRVTAIVTDTLTIARAQEASTARTVVAGDQIAATITDKVLTDLEPVIATAATLIDVVNSITETTVVSFTVPGGTLLVGRFLDLVAIADAQANPGGVLTIRVKYGGTVLAVAAPTLSASGNRLAISIAVRLAAQASASAQRSTATIVYGSSASAASAGNPPGGTGIAAAMHFVQVNDGVAVDSTVNQSLIVTFQWSASDPALSARLHVAHLMRN